MAPIFGETTMLVLTRLPFAELEPGMMVAYRNLEGFQVVHRLVERTARGEWTVRGLNNPRMDQERVTSANYLGVVYASLAHEERNPGGAPASRPHHLELNRRRPLLARQKAWWVDWDSNPEPTT
jgi:hypothetical protein